MTLNWYWIQIDHKKEQNSIFSNSTSLKLECKISAIWELKIAVVRSTLSKEFLYNYLRVTEFFNSTGKYRNLHTNLTLKIVKFKKITNFSRLLNQSSSYLNYSSLYIVEYKYSSTISNFRFKLVEGRDPYIQKMMIVGSTLSCYFFPKDSCSQWSCLSSPNESNQDQINSPVQHFIKETS